MWYCENCSKEKGLSESEYKSIGDCGSCGIMSKLMFYGVEELKTPDYFNTTQEFGSKLEESKGKARTQNNIILSYYRKFPDQTIGPTDVWRNCFDVDSVPITSIRRSISVLTKKGFLIKTDLQVQGMYGKMECKWKLKK